MREFPSCVGGILCAAVADFTPKVVAMEKIKRETTGEWNIPLLPTQDIARNLGQIKENRWLVGFALETHDETTHALDKMARKRLDAIVLNSLRDEGAGFGHDTNKVTIFTLDGREKALPLLPKTAVHKPLSKNYAKFLLTLFVICTALMPHRCGRKNLMPLSPSTPDKLRGRTPLSLIICSAHSLTSSTNASGRTCNFAALSASAAPQLHRAAI